MKRKDAVQIIEDVLRGAYDYPALTILDKLENAGMIPVTKRSGFSGTAVVNKWEEDITEKDWDRAFDNLGRE